MKRANEAVAKGPQRARPERRVSPGRSLMREMIARVGRLPGLGVEATPVEWSIAVRKTPGFDFEVRVPRPGRKWHATARDAATGRAVWSHVSTYHRGLGESVDDLATRVRQDIEWFLARLAKATEVRCTTEIALQVFGWAVVRRSVMEWKISGAWRPVDAVLLKLD